jgi:hypothetical protein
LGGASCADASACPIATCKLHAVAYLRVPLSRSNVEDVMSDTGDTHRDTPTSIRDWRQRVLVAERAAAVAEARAATVVLRRDPTLASVRRAQLALAKLADHLDDADVFSAHASLTAQLAIATTAQRARS